MPESAPPPAPAARVLNRPGMPLLAPLVIGAAVLAAVTMMLHRWDLDRRLNLAAATEIRLNREAQDIGGMLELGQAEPAWPRAEQLVADAEALAAGTASPEWSYATLRGRALLLRGEAALALNKDTDGAEKDFTAALRLFRDVKDSAYAPRARLGIARARLARGDAKTAEAELSTLLTRNANYGAAYAWRARARRALEDTRGAEQDEETARKFGLLPD